MPQKRSVKPNNVDLTTAPIPRLGLRLFIIFYHSFSTLKTVDIKVVDVCATDVAVHVGFDG